jgi:signal transduction histidine kinase
VHQAYLENQLAAQSGFTEFFMVNRQGQVRVSTDPERRGTNVTEEPYFSLIDEVHTAYLQPPYLERDSGEIQMLILCPIVAQNGSTVGLFVGRLDMTVLADVMTTRVGLGETGETLIVNADGVLVSPSLDPTVDIGDTIRTEPLMRALDGETGAGIFESYRGVDVVGVYTWLPELQTALIAQIDLAEAVRPYNDARNIALVSTMLIALLAAAVGVMLTRWLTNPIKNLKWVANRVVAGDYTPRADVTHNNEFGELAQAFNHMTDELVTTIDMLNERVEELAEATRRAQESNRLKDEFLAVMSHELRTPLNASIGFLGLLKLRDNLPEAEKQLVARARVNNERLLGLINNILDLSRMEAGSLILFPAPFNLHNLVYGIQTEMSILAEQKGLTLSVHIAPDVPQTFVADVDAVRKIIMNLVSNAIKFTENGRVDLTLTHEEAILCITVADTGVGIPIHLQETVFERFRQVDASPRRVQGGSGLGLSIVQNLTRAMGGRLQLNSAPKEGSTFTVWLPSQQKEN